MTLELDNDSALMRLMAAKIWFVLRHEKDCGQQQGWSGKEFLAEH